MSSSATVTPTPGDSTRQASILALLLFLATALALAVRIAVPPALVDGLYNYVREGGAIYEKLHVGSYLLILMVPVALLSRPVFLRGEEIGKFRTLVRFCGLLLLLIGVLIATGRASTTGNLIDTYLVAGFAGLILLAQNASSRRLLGDMVLLICLLSAAMGIFEVVTRIRFINFIEGEAAFRPTGLAGHPLMLGLISATALAFVPLTAWKPWVKVAAMFLLFVGVAASGARLALIVTALEVLALLLLVPWTSLSRRAERKAKLGVLVLVLVGGAALLAVLAGGGLLSRFSDGVIDQNFLARTDIYQIFDLVSWRDIWFGADIIEITKIVNEKLRLPFIESSPVYFTFQLGLVLAVPFALLLTWFVLKLLRRQPRPAWIGTAVFLTIALSNNTLSQKTGVITLLVVLLVSYLDAVPGERTQRSPQR